MALVSARTTVRTFAGLIDDTGAATLSLVITDNVIDDALARVSDNLYLAAAEICDMLAGYYSPQAVSKSVGGTFNYNAQKVPDHYREMAKRLREMASTLSPDFESIEMNPGGVVEDLLVQQEIMRDSV